MLKECVESLLSLSLNNEEFEIILIDDGSDQNPMDYLAKQGNRIKYIRQDNAGPSSSASTHWSCHYNAPPITSKSSLPFCWEL